MKRLLIVGILLNTMMGVTNAATSVRLSSVVFGTAIDDGLNGSYEHFYSDRMSVANRIITMDHMKQEELLNLI